jgi:menaquinone-dependent protoporphyrinogen IX oxidase
VNELSKPPSVCKGKNVIVVYQSKYGTTGQYAAWIAEELGAELLERREAIPAKLREFDCVIYGGGLYAGGISGVGLVTKHPVKNLVVFTVGLADPENTDYTDILEKNFSAEMRKSLKVFHLRGGIDYKKLGFIHRGMMAILKMMTTRNPDSKLTDEDRMFMDTYGNEADFTDRRTIAPLECDNPYARGDVKMMEAEDGKYFDTIGIIAGLKQ